MISKEIFMFTSEEIAKVTGGVLVGGNSSVTAVSTDTRTLKNGDLFIAVKGEKFDGNEFIDTAIENGAAAVISDKKDRLPKKVPVIYVDDSRKAQLSLAGYYRDKFDLKLVGVTGSVGKTSMKDMVYSVLSSEFSTLKTEGNYNNDIGLPRTLFSLNENYSAAVIEMGMSNAGEISVLSKAAHPNCCIITNIGYCHIENLKTRENILKAKLEILDGATSDAPLIIYGEDEFLKKIKISDVNRRIIRYGTTPDMDVCGYGAVTENGRTYFKILFDGHEYDAEIPVVGQHNVLNALAAFAAGKYYGLSESSILRGMTLYEPSGNRQRFEERGSVTLIYDCYNASPTSMVSALKVLDTSGAGRRKIAVLGDMLELGDMSEELHRGLAEYHVHADKFFLYGHEMMALYDELSKFGVPAVYSEDKQELTRLLQDDLKGGEVVLFKGSHGMKMEEIADKIEG